ncbi:hypothetical protein ACS0TY_017417 [Phlomoides rotata]
MRPVDLLAASRLPHPQPPGRLQPHSAALAWPPPASSPSRQHLLRLSVVRRLHLRIVVSVHHRSAVADFGLAKLVLELELHTQVSTRVMGTFGYLAPEYASTGKLTEKSDVYSYGVVLLEIITGRKPVDSSQPLGDESLVEWWLGRACCWFGSYLVAAKLFGWLLGLSQVAIRCGCQTLKEWLCHDVQAAYCNSGCDPKDVSKNQYGVGLIPCDDNCKSKVKVPDAKSHFLSICEIFMY